MARSASSPRCSAPARAAQRLCHLAVWMGLAVSACASDGAPVTVFQEGVKKISGGRFLMRDGRVIEIEPGERTRVLSIPPVADLSAHLALTSSYEIWYLGERLFNRAAATLVPGDKAARLIGPHHAMRADGTVLIVDRDSARRSAEYAGATSCELGACLVGGNLVVGTKWWRGVIDLGGQGIEVVAGTIRRKDGLYEDGFAVLRADGVVVQVPDSTLPADPQISLLEGLPPIAHLHGGLYSYMDSVLYEDRAGSIWFSGASLPVALASTAGRDVPCTFYRPGAREALATLRCVGPLELPELRGSRPVVMDALYALYPNGKVLCWGTSCYPALP